MKSGKLAGNQFSSILKKNIKDGRLYIETFGIKYFIEKAYTSIGGPVIVLKKFGDDAKILVWISNTNSMAIESIKSNLNGFINSLDTNNDYTIIYKFISQPSGGSLRKRKGSKKKKSKKVRSEKKKRSRKNSRKK